MLSIICGKGLCTLCTSPLPSQQAAEGIIARQAKKREIVGANSCPYFAVDATAATYSQFSIEEVKL